MEFGSRKYDVLSEFWSADPNNRIGERYLPARDCSAQIQEEPLLYLSALADILSTSCPGPSLRIRQSTRRSIEPI